MTDSYVIGTSRTGLLKLTYSFDYIVGELRISRIMFGLYEAAEATVIPGLDNAIKTIEEIRANYNNIHVLAPTILLGAIDGNDFDPEDLHIYEVNVGKEIKV